MNIGMTFRDLCEEFLRFLTKRGLTQNIRNPGAYLRNRPVLLHQSRVVIKESYCYTKLNVKCILLHVSPHSCAVVVIIIIIIIVVVVVVVVVTTITYSSRLIWRLIEVMMI
jgi:hypothetical protein